MDDIWTQFHGLPKAIKDTVASPSVLAVVDRLEREYPGIDLASLVMRLMVKEFPFSELPARLQSEGGLDTASAVAITDELRRDVFADVADYLGLNSAAPPVALTPPANLPTADQPISLAPEPMPAAPSPLPMTPIGSVAPTQAYSAEDAAEIQHHTDRLKTLGGQQPPADIDEITRQIIEKNALSFSDELMNRRAVAVVKARLKGMRSRSDTQAMLARDPKVGGLGIDADLASALTNTIEQQAQVLLARGMVHLPTPLPPLAPPPIPQIVVQKPEPKPPLDINLPVEGQAPPPAPLPQVTDLPRPAPQVKSLPEYATVEPVPMPTAVQPPPSLPPPPYTSPAPAIPPRRTSDRPTTADVSWPVQTTGPVEEMRNLTLAQFRRLGQDAEESAKQLLKKLTSWQKESYTLWEQAVNAWRQSEVTQIYLSMGQQSLEDGIPLSQVIQTRARDGQPYLSEHEFGAVADFNRQLQF